jgi:hypothetical protein
MLCLVDGWAERNGHEALAYVLDNGPHQSEANKRVFEFFQRYHEVTKEGPSNQADLSRPMRERDAAFALLRYSRFRRSAADGLRRCDG